MRMALHALPQRKALCTYYSSDPPKLVAEIREAYRGASAANSGAVAAGQAAAAGSARSRLLAVVVPHGAACDGFRVAANAYRQLAEHLHAANCSSLTAVLLGTEHRGTTTIALSRKCWMTPLGAAAVDAAAVDWLAAGHGIPISEAPHASEHSIENQLPFLVHAAGWGWDLQAAGCCAAAEQGTAAVPIGTSVPNQQQHQQQQQRVSATLSIVPISIGYLGHQPELIQRYGAAVADLLQHLKTCGSHRHHQQQQQQKKKKLKSDEAETQNPIAGGNEVVLIVTTDFTHAGPWYRELPPPGVSLEAYMAAQDSPLLQAVQQGSVQGLLSAAATTRNSLCGLYPLAVGLEALYGGSSSSSSGGVLPADVPQLLVYMPAHLIFPRPNSTGFAAFTVHSK